MSNSIRWTPEQLADYEKRRRVPEKITQDSAPAAPASRSRLEERFEQQLNEAGLWPATMDTKQGYVIEYYPVLGRDWRLDFAWAQRRPPVAVEVQGGVHRIKGKHRADIEKRAALMLAGWRVLEIDGATIRDGRALQWLLQLLA